jgi:hypothetical protein
MTAYKPFEFRWQQTKLYDPEVFDLIPLHKPKAKKRNPETGRVREVGKAPVDLNWTKKTYDSKKVLAAAKASSSNVGIRLTADQLVIDVDPRNGGEAGFNSLCVDLGIDGDEFPRVITGSGGWHCYMSKPADVKVIDTLKAYQGVEFKSVGRQVVAAGSVHPNGQPYTWSDEHPDIGDKLPRCPKKLLRLITRAEHEGVQSGGQYSPERVAMALAKLDPRDFKDQSAWLALMMGIHHASAGDARSEFIEWSIGDPTYEDDADIIGRRWDSLHAEKHDGITYLTFEKTLRDHGAENMQAPREVGDDFDDDADEPETGDDEPLAEDETPDWLKTCDDDDGDGVLPERPPLDDWQFITEAMQFVYKDGKRMLGEKQARYEFGHVAKKGADVIQRIQRGKLKIKKYDRQVYIPNSPMVLMHEGEEVFNIWRPSAMIPKVGDHRWFLDHVAYMFPDQQSQDYLLDFMAQLIQHPEVKINFALMLQSKQGVGKGAIGVILRRVIGKRNVVEPTNDELKKSFTGWQEGAQLAIINEMCAKGTDLVERLKQPITEDSLRIEKKFGNAFSIPNHMNIIANTNHKDALTLSDDDRRWLVLFSAAPSRPESYYEKLFANIDDDSKIAAVMHYLVGRTIKLNPKGKAPTTAAKREMGDRTRTDVHVALQTLFDARQSPFDFDLIRIDPVIDAVKEVSPGERNKNAAVCNFLDHVGAVKLKRYTHGDLPAYQLYAIRDQERWIAEKPVKAVQHFVSHLEKQLADDGLDFG